GEVLHSPPDPLLEADSGLPAQDLGRAAGVETAPANVASLRRSVSRLDVLADALPDHLVELVDVGLDPGSDVEAPGGVGLGSGDHRVHHVADVDVVAGAGAIAVDDRGAALEESMDEDRHHARLPVGVLARPIDV